MSIGSHVSKSKGKIFKYLRHEVYGNDMRVHYLNEEGHPVVFTIGNSRSDCEFIVVAVGWGGRLYDGAPPHNVGFMLWREGSPTKRVGPPDDYREVSHMFNVELSREECRVLGQDTLQFMDGEDENQNTRVLAF